MAEDLDLTSLIKKAVDLIYDNFRYFVPRIGEVLDVNDTLKKGRVLVAVPSLGWNTKDQGAWCFPKEKKSIKTPAVGDFVLIEWIDADRDLPIYSAIASNIADMLPKNYDGNATTDVLYENNDGTTYVKYDSLTKEFIFEDENGNKMAFKPAIIELDGTLFKMFGGTEAFLNGTTFDSWLTNTLLNIFNSHTHQYTPGTGTPTQTGSPTPPLTGPSGHLSTKITGE